MASCENITDANHLFVSRFMINLHLLNSSEASGERSTIQDSSRFSAVGASSKTSAEIWTTAPPQHTSSAEDTDVAAHGDDNSLKSIRAYLQHGLRLSLALDVRIGCATTALLLSSLTERILEILYYGGPSRSGGSLSVRPCRYTRRAIYICS